MPIVNRAKWSMAVAVWQKTQSFIYLFLFRFVVGDIPILVFVLLFSYFPFLVEALLSGGIAEVSASSPGHQTDWVSQTTRPQDKYHKDVDAKRNVQSYKTRQDYNSPPSREGSNSTHQDIQAQIPRALRRRIAAWAKHYCGEQPVLIAFTTIFLLAPKAFHQYSLACS